LAIRATDAVATRSVNLRANDIPARAGPFHVQGCARASRLGAFQLIG